MRFAVLFLFFSCLALTAQVDELSLEGLTDEQLLLMFDEVTHDSIAAERVARIYLDRAKRDQDTIRMARGYDRLARAFSPETNLKYADTVIALTAGINHITYPGLGYILKGFEFQQLGDLINSTENFLIAYELSKNTENVQQQVYILHSLIFNKAIWGNRQEALALQRERHRIITSRTYKSEIRSVSRTSLQSEIEEYFISDLASSFEMYAFVFLKLGVIDSVDYYMTKSYETVDLMKKRDSIQHSNWLSELELEKLVVLERYNEAIRLGDKLLTRNYFKEDPSSASNIYMQLGLANMYLNNVEYGVSNLIQADSIRSMNKLNFQPNDRVIYRELADYYQGIGDQEKTIENLDKLIAFDQLLEKNYRFFEPRYIKNIDTPNLIAEKQEVINSLQQRRISTVRSAWILGALAFLGLFGLVFYYQRQRQYKQRFEALLSQQQKGKTAKKGGRRTEMSSELIVEILSRLDQFESNKGYLDTDLSLNLVAKHFGTNTKYLSSVVNLKKSKNFSQYINGLRTEYALERLQSDRLFRRYTIKAIAAECGFNRAESFSKAFYKRFGIYPSYFIKQIELDVDVDGILKESEAAPSSP